MFTGTVEARSHEGGLLVHFEGSSPALNAIMVRADDGTYIGKVDGVIGSTNHPLAHVAHIDRSLDMDTLIGVGVTVRAKQKPKEHRGERREGGRGGDRRDGGRREHGRRDDRGRRDNNRGFRNDRGGRDNRGGDRQQRGTFNDNDWTCPECKNSNFAFRHVCNRCEAPRPGGGGGQRRERYDRGGRDNRERRDDNRGFRNDRGRRDDNRGFRNDRGGRDNRDGGRQQRGTFNDNDWTCPKCKNSNFAFRNVCNRCEEPRPGGGGGGGRRGNDRGRRDDNRGFRNDRGRRDDNRGFRNDRGRRDDNRGFRNDRGTGRNDGQQRDNDRGRDRDGGQQRGRPSYGRGGSRPQHRRSSDVQPRRAKGKRSGHAHNQPPRDFRDAPRKFERRDD
ncbi:MAG: hypothetical protein DWC03_07080 [Candidatus Poseidoniales archaeon]|nr:MAG: hypothetical protein DWC03_07080 [Candidatus Poseidoniales archaeon]